jgi:hypothetical protein
MIEIPFDSDEYESKLKELIKTSKFIKKVQNEVEVDISKSFT